MLFSPLIEQLISALRCLPGVGPKTAQRMAFQLLQSKRESGLQLANALQQAMSTVGNCQSCYTLCETEQCHLCKDPRRDSSLLCIVETPADVVAFEQTSTYRGYYFVLMGRLSPLDGIGPQEIGIDRLLHRISQNDFQEVVLATNTTVEGEATAHYIANLMHEKNIKCTRIAYGVPVNREFDYLDENTLARAFLARTSY